MRGIPLKKLLLAAGLLILFGIAKLPLERGIEAQMREGELLEESVDLPMLEQLGQGGFAAVLGGFRPLVASILYIVAHVSAFDREDWAEVDQQFGLITTLQPRNGHYWDQYVWHIGWNAHSFALREADYERHRGSEWKAWNLDNVTAPGYLNRAESVALKGAAIVKDDYRFYQRIGFLYHDKLNNPYQGARWFQKGSEIEGAPSFMFKIYANMLSKCPGYEDEAYPLIRARYWDPDNTQRSPSVKDLEALEDRLARRELEKGVDAVRQSIAAEPHEHLHRVALAIYYAEVEKSPEKAMREYEEMMRPESGVEQVPEFYLRKWALLAAGVPERERFAYNTLRKEFSKMRRRLTPEEEAVIRPLEDRLDIPQGDRIIRGKKKAAPRVE